MKYKKTHEDYVDDLNRHLKQIIKICHEFDKGDREGMLHVTTSLRTIFKDKSIKNPKSQTVSLLKRLDKTDIDLVDIAGIGAPVSLAPMFAGGLSLHDYVPRLNTENKRWIPLDEWYSGLVLFSKGNYSITRKHLIEDFGEKYVQHSDNEVPLDLHYLFNNINDYVGWKMVAGGIQIKQPNIIYSSLRMICHEVIISFQKHKLGSLDINRLYNAQLRDIKPYSPFGDFIVSITRKEDISVEFYCNHKGRLGKLLITGEYALANHKENLPDIKKYIYQLVDELISRNVYDYIESNNIPALGIKEFKVNEYIDIDADKLAVVHKPSQKFQLVEKLLVKFNFTIDIKKIKT